MNFPEAFTRGYWLIHLDTEGGKHEFGPFSSQAEAEDYVDHYLIGIEHEIRFHKTGLVNV